MDGIYKAKPLLYSYLLLHSSIWAVLCGILELSWIWTSSWWILQKWGICILQVLAVLLPQGMIVPSAFETVGHIAHLNLRDEHFPYKKLIAKVPGFYTSTTFFMVLWISAYFLRLFFTGSPGQEQAEDTNSCQ